MNPTQTFSLAIHGGAGTLLRSEMDPEKERQYRQGLLEALQQGSECLSKGGSALDAVEIAVRVLENNPLFNAGKGAVFTHDGTHEMDAAIMCGKTGLAGSVAGVQQIKNPVSLARAVMEKTAHVLLAGEGALAFAKSIGIALEVDSYFYDELRFKQWQEAMKTGEVWLDHKGSEKKFGTVGAVALDIYGNLAAATSTGGMTNKKFGRIGDSPLIGCGTFASNQTAAISCTGHGEFFIRKVVAHRVCDLMELKGLPLNEAAFSVVMDELAPIGGEGGLIALDLHGRPVFAFNSEGMYRGWVDEKGEMNTAIYSNEA